MLVVDMPTILAIDLLETSFSRSILISPPSTVEIGGPRLEDLPHSRYVPDDALPGTSNRFVNREPSHNSQDRGGATRPDDIHFLGVCLHALECSGRSRPESVGACHIYQSSTDASGARWGRWLSARSAQSRFASGVCGCFCSGVWGLFLCFFGVGTSQDLGH